MKCPQCNSNQMKKDRSLGGKLVCLDCGHMDSNNDQKAPSGSSRNDKVVLQVTTQLIVDELLRTKELKPELLEKSKAAVDNRQLFEILWLIGFKDQFQWIVNPRRYQDIDQGFGELKSFVLSTSQSSSIKSQSIKFIKLLSERANSIHYKSTKKIQSPFILTEEDTQASDLKFNPRRFVPQRQSSSDRKPTSSNINKILNAIQSPSKTTAISTKQNRKSQPKTCPQCGADQYQYNNHLKRDFCNRCNYLEGEKVQSPWAGELLAKSSKEKEVSRPKSNQNKGWFYGILVLVGALSTLVLLDKPEVTSVESQRPAQFETQSTNTCWFTMPNGQTNGSQCEVSSRKNVNGHKVIDVVEPNGTKRSVVLWANNDAEVFLKGDLYNGSYSSSGRIVSIEVNEKSFKFQAP